MQLYNASMRILFLTPQLPYPPQKGTALRNWGLISGLAERHEIAVLSFATPEQTVDALLETGAVYRAEALPVPTRSVYDRLRSLMTTRLPDLALRLGMFNTRAAQRLERLLERLKLSLGEVA